MDELIRHNLELMKSNEEGGMQDLLSGESMGGNAGSYQGRPCLGANFFYNTYDGKIEYFGNWQNVPLEIRNKNQWGRFRVVWQLGTIIECHLDQNEHSLFATTSLARNNLEETVRFYNLWRKEKQVLSTETINQEKQK